jgi:cephalosporin-C deacetylase
MPLQFDMPLAQIRTYMGVNPRPDDFDRFWDSKLLRSRDHSEPHPAILIFHGYSGSSGDWYDKLGYVAQGYTLAAMDCRGQSGSSEDTGGLMNHLRPASSIRRCWQRGRSWSLLTPGC